MISKSELVVGQIYHHELRGVLEFTEACEVLERIQGIDPTSSFFYVIDDNEVAELSLGLISVKD
jgi:hypothetical protein